MKKNTLIILAGVLVSLLLMTSVSRADEDGAALYKANCAMCHKADASGNPAMKSPAIKGKTYADVKKAVDTSPKHAGVKSKLNDDQLKAITEYLKGLK